jgi:hypothetical protein
MNNKVLFYINKGEGKLNYVKEKEYKINPKLKPNQINSEIIRGIATVNYDEYNLIILVIEISNKIYDLKVYSLTNFELITHFSNIYLFPNKGLMTFMTCNNDDKKLYLVLGDKNDRIMVVQLFDEFDIYENISLSKIIKELLYNKNNIYKNYEIKSIYGLNDETFVICLYYLEANNEKNYIIRGRINNKTKKFELLYINDNLHNNKSNFITTSTYISNNKKLEEKFYVSCDHEGMIKVWKMKNFFSFK